jgi:hypothetical protein
MTLIDLPLYFSGCAFTPGRGVKEFLNEHTKNTLECIFCHMQEPKWGRGAFKYGECFIYYFGV